MEQISHVPIRGVVRERRQTPWGEAVLFAPCKADACMMEIGTIWWPVAAIQIKGEGATQSIVVPFALLAVVCKMFEPMLLRREAMILADERVVKTLAQAFEEQQQPSKRQEPHPPGRQWWLRCQKKG